MLKPSTRFAHVRDIRLRYVDWGENGPPLLMLHGDMRTSRSWDAVARALCNRFRVICMDARGHGDSDWPPRGYTMTERVNDLSAFCDHIGLRGAIGVGHSTGASVVPLCARRSSAIFSQLVLLEPGLRPSDDHKSRAASRGERPRRTWTSRRELHEFLKQHPTAGRWRDNVMEDVVNHESMELPDGSIDMKWASATFNREDLTRDQYNLPPVLSRLSLPILFITSEERKHRYDELHPLARAAPNFRMVTIKDTGHNMYMERPETVSWAIKQFANDQEIPTTI